MKRVTIKEVANQAGVSYQTVSKVINRQVRVSPETELRIWEAVRELGYTPSYNARSLRSNRSYTLGYSWPPSPPDQVNPILDQFLQSMFDAAERHGYYLLSFPFHLEQTKQLAAYAELIDTGRVDGFVISSVEFNDPRVLFLQEKGFPFVAFGRSNPDLIFPSIDVDGGLGIRLAVEHLLTLGQRKIAVLAWPEDSRVGDNRMNGYYSALQSAGISIHPEWIIRGEGITSFGYQAALQLLALPEDIRPTAIIGLNDPMAIGAMLAVQHCGLTVGKDVLITGFDDAPMTQYLNPGLTTVRQPIWEIGQMIIRNLIQFVETGQAPEPVSIMLAPELIVRGSTAGKDQYDWMKEGGI